MDTTGIPRYDPKAHGDDDFVFVEMFADNGELFRRADPLHVIRPDAEEWVARVTATGARPASPQWALNARSGTPPEENTVGAADYSDRKVPKGHDGTTATWPFEPAELDADDPYSQTPEG